MSSRELRPHPGSAGHDMLKMQKQHLTPPVCPRQPPGLSMRPGLCTEPPTAPHCQVLHCQVLHCQAPHCQAPHRQDPTVSHSVLGTDANSSFFASIMLVKCTMDIKSHFYW
ncbi:hypothetical protein P7K49_012918 [Saguinus oedipus]|uniref:Uncharacterized protein n=1 Tax=Saguinus oedipus TaxID=9490 RepID=A0ABQ9VGJ0_SAGOE|nr:hypothetical protein P7K49_012918 [Saguinus oedipus]